MSIPKRPVVFLLVGVVNTLIDYLFYTFLTQAIFPHESSIALVGVISGTAALMMAFVTHSLITWRGRDISHLTVMRFIIATGLGMWILRPVLLTVFLRFDGLYDWVFSLAQAFHLPLQHNFIAKTGAFGFMVVILLVYNYLVYNRFVFHDKSTGTDHKSHSKS